MVDAIRHRYADGALIAGTSAGAAVMSELMIPGSPEEQRFVAGNTPISLGFALAPELIIDQHFRQRDRLGRLITALSFHPSAVGIGLDEDTAAWIRPDHTLEVTGSGGVTIVDPRDVEFCSADSAERDEPISAIGLRLHVLVDGGTYDISTREARPAPAPTGKV